MQNFYLLHNSLMPKMQVCEINSVKPMLNSGGEMQRRRMRYECRKNASR